mgnify:CR=1 FL=1
MAPVVQRAARSGPGAGLSQSASQLGAAAIQEATATGLSGPSGQLPFLDKIQRSFGRHDVSGVKSYTDSAAQAGARSLGAEAFTFGNQVAFGQAPTLHTAAHEAAHVIQQQGGVRLKSGIDTPGDIYERQADAIADLVVSGRSAEPWLDRMLPSSGTGAAPVVQRKLGGGLQVGCKVIHHTLKEDEDGFEIVEVMDSGYKIKGPDGQIQIVDLAAIDWATEKDQFVSRRAFQKQHMKQLTRKKVDVVAEKEKQEEKDENGKVKTDLSKIEQIKLTKNEWAAIQLYTTTLYAPVNRFLRGYADDADKKQLNDWLDGGNNNLGVKTIHEYAKIVAEGMKKIPEFKAKQYVSRGANLDPTKWAKKGMMHEYQQGCIVADPGFMSTAFGTPFAKDSLIMIDLPEGHLGRDISWLSAYGVETEILFPPGAAFHIDQIINRDSPEFDLLFDQLVAKKDNESGRFNIVKRIIRGHMLPPKEQEEFDKDPKGVRKRAIDDMELTRLNRQVVKPAYKGKGRPQAWFLDEFQHQRGKKVPNYKGGKWLFPV